MLLNIRGANTQSETIVQSDIVFDYPSDIFPGMEETTF